MMTRRWRLLGSVAAVVVLATAARADTLWVGSNPGSALELKDVRVLRMEGGRVFFRTASGGTGESSREAGQIQRMALDDEPGLTSAETAWFAGDFDKATDEYLRVMRSTAKPWLKQWSGLRLVRSAGKANRLDAAVAAYVELVQLDAKLAQENRPALDGSVRPAVLTAAATTLEGAIGRQPRTASEQRTALRQLLLEVHRARGDAASAAKVLEEMTAGDGGAVAGAGDAAASARGQLADLRLSAAKLALDARDFAKAASMILESESAFVEPRQQAEALFVLAAAREGEARTQRDSAKLKDAALAYMRVVAHFRGIAGAEARVPAALLKTGQILEELGEKAEARSVYREVVDLGDPATKDGARQGLERLK
jgi:tetratricopeptide (TPR) repeat protein